MKQSIIILLFILVAINLKGQTKASNNNTIMDTNKMMPEFPGGLETWFKFLSKNLKWADGDFDGQSKIIVSFIVEKDGRLTHFKILRRLSPKFDQEVLRVMKLSPKWIPAMQNGKPVRKRFDLPINIELSE